MAYLRDLTLRLATGVGQLAEVTRARHANYLVQAQRADGGFAGRAGESDLYYTGFALRSLALLGELHGPLAERAAEFLRSRLTSQVAIIDFLSLVYGAMLLDMSAGVDVFATAPPRWREAVAAALERYRRPDGGYAMTEVALQGSTYYTFLMVLCHEVIEHTTAEPGRLIEFVRSRHREDGGFVELGAMRKSGTNPTAAAVGLLRILGETGPVREPVLDFLVERQTDEGGFQAHSRIPVADVLSTFTALLTLGDLDALDEIERPAAERYVRSMESPAGGFHLGALDESTDVEYTFYGLGALALLSQP